MPGHECSIVFAAGLGLCGLAVLAGGCARRPAQVAPPEPLAIPVSKPIVRSVTDFADFTGRTEAVHSVDVRPRATGYLVEMPFKEGTEVKAGDLLFVIDRALQGPTRSGPGAGEPVPAQLKLANHPGEGPGDQSAHAQRREPPAARPGGSGRRGGRARVRAYEKNMEVYRLNREFTRVTSPIDGMVSRYYLTVGNLVNQDQTLLTTIVSLDPMFAYFDVDEPTVLRVRRAINEGRIKPRSSGMRSPC